MKSNALKPSVTKNIVLDPYKTTGFDSFILNLELQRMEKGWSQEFLADRAEIPVKDLIRLESGDGTICATVLMVVMSALSDDFDTKGLAGGYDDVIDRFVIGDELVARRKAAFETQKAD